MLVTLLFMLEEEIHLALCVAVPPVRTAILSEYALSSTLIVIDALPVVGTFGGEGNLHEKPSPAYGALHTHVK